MSELRLRVVEAGMRQGESDAIHDFLQKNWQRGIALTRPAFYDWQFKQAPANKHADACILLLDDDDEIHGFMGLNKRDFAMGPQVVAGCELTTWVLAESVRGLGMGRRIIKKLQSTYDVMVGMGISVDALRVYLPQGFKYMRHVPRYVRVFDPEAASSLLVDGAPWSSKYVPLVAELPSAPQWSEIPAEALERFSSQAHTENSMFVRDAANLHWRYTSHPVFTYRAFALRLNRLSCGLVLRIDETAGGIRYCHVMDILGSVDATPLVVPFLEDFCTSHGVVFADFYCTNPLITRHLWCRGWASAVDDPLAGITNLLHPVEPSIPPTTSMIVWSKDLERTLDVSRLYITKADGDMDRPTLTYLAEKGIEL